MPFSFIPRALPHLACRDIVLMFDPGILPSLRQLTLKGMGQLGGQMHPAQHISVTTHAIVSNLLLYKPNAR